MRNVDALVISLKEHYDPRSLIGAGEALEGVPFDLRYVGLRFDLPPLQRVLRDLQGFSGVVFVVTNPVDLLTVLVTRALREATVFGLGCTLDTARFQVIVSEALGVGLSRLCLPLGGLHGGQLVPLESLWKYPERVRGPLREVREACLERSKSIGVEIVRKQGFTLEDCAFVFAENIAAFLSVSGSTRVAEMATAMGRGACGRPFELRGRGRASAVDVSSSAEREALERCSAEIVGVYNAVRRLGLW